MFMWQKKIYQKMNAVNIKIMEQVIEQINLSGIYNIWFLDLTKEEVFETDEYGTSIYQFTIQW